MHEAAHAWAAKRGGDLTAYRGGQVSIDPMPHIRREPFGMVILPILSVIVSGWPLGFASAPYDPVWAERYPKRAAWMSLAGPGANLLLLIAMGVAIRVGVAGDAFYAPDSVVFDRVVAARDAGFAASAAFVLSVFFSMNLLLLLLNLIPLPPLDGSGALPLVLPEAWMTHYREWMRNPTIAIVGILIAWQLIGAIWDVGFVQAVNLLYPEFQYG